MVKVRWDGPRITRRVIWPYVWSHDTGFVQDVEDAPLAAELLTTPGGQFALAEDEPLLRIKGIGPHTVGDLVMAGVAGLADLAGLDDEGLAALAEETGLGEKRLTTWAQKARDLVRGEARGLNYEEEER